MALVFKFLTDHSAESFSLTEAATGATLVSLSATGGVTINGELIEVSGGPIVYDDANKQVKVVEFREV